MDEADYEPRRRKRSSDSFRAQQGVPCTAKRVWPNGSGRLGGMPTNPSDEPAALAHALLDRLFALLHDCRAVVPQLEPGGQRQEPVSAQAERLLYYALVGALEAGLVRTAEDALTVLRQASQPLGPMGAEWLQRQEQDL